MQGWEDAQGRSSDRPEPPVEFQGVQDVTPWSTSRVKAALAHAQRLIEARADSVDIGARDGVLHHDVTALADCGKSGGADAWRRR